MKNEFKELLIYLGVIKDHPMAKNITKVIRLIKNEVWRSHFICSNVKRSNLSEVEKQAFFDFMEKCNPSLNDKFNEFTKHPSFYSFRVNELNRVWWYRSEKEQRLLFLEQMRTEIRKELRWKI